MHHNHSPLKSEEPLILATLDREAFFLKLDEFLGRTDRSFRTENPQSIYFFCHYAGTRKIRRGPLLKSRGQRETGDSRALKSP